MKRPQLPPERERHPALDTFERVLNNGVIVDRGSDERSRAAERIRSHELFVKYTGSSHPLFLGETWRTKHDG